MKKYFNQQGLAEYPKDMTKAFFCCWKMEKAGNRMTKVPYDPKTGKKARVDKISTFASMDDAVMAYETGKYDGIGINLSGSIGSIDVDHCIKDGILSATAQKILAIFPGAHVEYSPSHNGLHLFFTVPENFAFDKGQFFINNRNAGVEIYLPGSTKRFMTVTADVIRSGDMRITEEQLSAFLDAFMKRPNNPETSVTPPEDGSVLSDAEVIYKLCLDPEGGRFMSLYRGDWENAAPEDAASWSQSEADMSLCAKLAFYCRGDMEQMDRLFRASGLMRDKWDQRHGASTYGEMTIRNAINHCTAFYEPQGGRASEDFTVIDYASVIDALLDAGATVEAILSEDALTAAAWAYKNDTLRYTRLRQAVPKEVGIRNYERAVKQRASSLRTDDEHGHEELMDLTGITTPGMLIPSGWAVDDSGIYCMGVRVSAEPLFISAKMVNVDDGTEKLEVTFRRNGSYKALIAPRSDMLNKNSIIRYADSGLPVSSGNSAMLTGFIAAMENTNDRVIPLKRCIRRAGWVGNMRSSDNAGSARIEFFPYYLRSPMTGQEDEENAERFLEHLKTEGDEGVWLDMAAKVRTMPFARAMLAASFASPLLYPLQHRNIYYHSWFDSKSGKTAALKFAMSVWGDPSALVKSYFSTMVGMEHRAGTMKHLPLALDELQTLEKRMDVNNMVYTLGNGVGKTRGRAGGGIRAIDDWRNCILSTGEQPISTDNSMDGVNTRLLEVYAAPVPDQNLAMQMHQVAERNFGFAGEKFIRWIVEKVIMASSEGCGKQGEDGHSGVDGGKDDHKDNHSGGSRLQTDYETIRSALDMIFGDRYVGAENIAVIALADYYASMAVFGLDHGTAFGEALELGAAIMDARKQEDHTDTVDRGWNFVTGWVAANKSKFGGSIYSPSEYFGTAEGGKLYVISSILNDALGEAGFSYKKCIRGFAQRGYVGTVSDALRKNRTQMQKKINGVNTRVYALNIELKSAENTGDVFAD